MGRRYDGQVDTVHIRYGIGIGIGIGLGLGLICNYMMALVVQ